MAAPSAERTRKYFCVALVAFPRSVVISKNCFAFPNSVKRQATGIWKCLRCKKVMAGGAYVLSTSAAITAKTAVQRLRKTTKGDTA